MSAPHESRPGSLAALRTANRERLLTVLDSGSTVSQADLARATGLSPATISGLVRTLGAEGELVVHAGVTNGRRGRLVQRAQRRVRSGIGIDLGRTHARVVLGSGPDSVAGEAVRQLPPGLPPPEVVRTVAELVTQVSDESGVANDEVVGVVMGVPRPVDVTTGTLAGDPGLSPWGGLPLGDLMSESLQRKVRVDNDANLGALALSRHPGVGDPVVFLKIASGIGAGIVTDGRLLRGRSGTAGDIGHLTLDPRLAVVCRCGRRGCLETMASTEAIASSLASALGGDHDVADVVELVEAGNPVALQVLREAGEVVGRALGWLATILNPQDIVVGGPLTPLGKALLTPVRRGFRQSVLPAVSRDTTLTLSPLGERTEAIGALVAALDRTVPG